jgi:hypothetical protein
MTMQQKLKAVEDRLIQLDLILSHINELRNDVVRHSLKEEQLVLEIVKDELIKEGK